MQFFEYERENSEDRGVLLETFFEFERKRAKSINDLSREESVSLEVPSKGLFPFYHDMQAAKEIKNRRSTG